LTRIHVLDHYQEGDSVIHRLDPRVKLVLTLAFIVAITALPAGVWLSYVLCLLTIASFVVLSQTQPLLVLRRSLVAIPFTLAALTLVFTVEGTTVAVLELARWSLTVTAEGIIAFTSILIKAWLSVLMATMLVTTTPFPDLVAGMRALKVPRIIVSVVSFMYRYIFVIADEALRLHRAREARSASPKGAAGRDLLWRAKVLGGMIGSLFLRSYERSERIYAAMLSRGFDGQIRVIHAGTLGSSDFVIGGAFLAFLLTIVILSRVQRGV
jgi:cobalt/nickel transport system permease protein